MVVLGASLFLSLMGAEGPASDPAYVHRLEDFALIEHLNGELLASRSATLTLEHWCGVQGLSAQPRLVARRTPEVKEASTETRARLQVGPEVKLGVRHVELMCGDKVLSVADNWYVRERLTAAMNQALDETDTPFGRVVAPLAPERKTLGVTWLWRPLAESFAVSPSLEAESPRPPFLFVHHALLAPPNGPPIAEVEERYTSAVLDFPRTR